MNKYVLSKQLYLWSLIYLGVLILLHWRLRLDIGILIFILGAFVGLHLLRFAEAAVNMSVSPFRSLVSIILINAVTIFVLTSSSLPLGKGVVLFLNLHLLFLLHTEYKTKSHLSLWLPAVPVTQHKTYFVIFWALFIFESLLFIFI